jgi:Protein of unknown function (DUF2752)
VSQARAIERAPSRRVPAVGLLAAGVLLPLLGHPGIACPLRTATGIPCPLCGMSTSVQSTVRGRWSDALVSNPMGIALVVAAIAFVAGWRFDVSRIPIWSIWTILAAMWIFQLFRFSVV